MRKMTVLIMILILALAACGGDDDEDTTPEAAAPDTAAEVTDEPETTETNGENTPEAEATELVEVGVEPLELPDNLLPNTFIGDVNARLFVLEGRADTPVSITMNGTSPDLDPYLVLMTLDGRLLTVDDDGAGSNLDAAISGFTLPEDGTYLLLATSSRGVAEPVVINDDTGEADPQSFNMVYDGVDALLTTQISELGLDPVPAEGEIDIPVTVEQPLVLLPMQLEAGQTLSMTTQSEEFSDSLLYLFDPLGNRVVVNDGEGEDPSARIDGYTVPEAGLYLVIATVGGYTNPDSPFFSAVPYTLVVE